MARQFKWKQRSPYAALFHAISRGEVREMSSFQGFSLNQSGKKQKARFAGQKNASTKKKALTQGFRSLFMVVMILVSAGLIGWFGYSMGRAGLPLQMIFQMSAFFLIFVSLFGGIFSAANYLYFTRDIPFYLSLPLSSRQIVRAKVSHFLLISILGNLMILLIPVGAMIAIRASWKLYIVAILAFFLAAGIIDLFMTLLTMLFMRFSRWARNKDRFNKVFSVIMVVFALLLTLLIQSISLSETSSSDISNRFSSLMAYPLLRGILILCCPPLAFSHKLFSPDTGTVLLGFLYTLLILAAYSALLYLASDRWYLQTVMRIQEHGGKARSKAPRQDGSLRKLLGPRPTAQALRDYEKIKLQRNPNFFNNFILSPLTMPLYILLIMGVSGFVQAKKSEQGFMDIFNKIRSMAEGVQFQDETLAYIVFGIFIWTALNGMIGFSYRLLPSTDGEDFFFLKALPISTRLSLRAKANYMNRVGLLPNLCLLVILILLFGLPALPALYCLALYLAAQFSALYFCLALGALYPKLHWENENQFLKSPSNVFWVYGMMITTALLLAPAVLALLASPILWNFYSWEIAYTLVILIQVAVGTGAYFFCMNHASLKLARAE